MLHYWMARHATIDRGSFRFLPVLWFGGICDILTGAATGTWARPGRVNGDPQRAEDVRNRELSGAVW